ncbi:hypothetical protein GCM10023336_54340 [Streptomyces similanensis]|uniref:Uncharacterized protein n=1 Tax=Streptomyces similanensis TaxID=1274988 RepID=A0ABP9L7N6_9ACTN
MTHSIIDDTFEATRGYIAGNQLMCWDRTRLVRLGGCGPIHPLTPGTRTVGTASSRMPNRSR